MNLLWNAQEDIRSLKSLILFGVRGMAAYAHHAMMLGYADEEVNRFFAKALFAVGEDWDMDALLPIVMEVGVGKGDTMDGIPGKDATYTGYHYARACHRPTDGGEGAVHRHHRPRSPRFETAAGADRG